MGNARLSLDEEASTLPLPIGRSRGGTRTVILTLEDRGAWPEHGTEHENGRRPPPADGWSVCYRNSPVRDLPSHAVIINRS
ncbi:hypothetical protein Sp245p_28730 (plasmid) [Azospirillum baldaniorum]|uniref:Uncharacterized protein n=1 Tax=Azospirillum baldaniorum TaxID=1064539 RepID=A0A9P1JY50_9PROT|nr:hypothetical protein Sp245p_28730 [Azospirillum baldaniorum]CCD01959.1 protein of unknown function [Azospirillum baldaniorum]